MSPKTLLLILIIIGATAANLLWLRPVVPPPPAVVAPPPAVLPAEPVTGASLFPDGEQKPEQARLEEMVAHLETQVKVLTEENTALLQKLGSLGMKKDSQPVPAPVAAAPQSEADYVGLGADLARLRELPAEPIPTMTSTEPAVTAMILAWLRKLHGADHGRAEGAALYALGLVPESLDTLPARAALLARKLTGWYDAETGTLHVIPPHKEPGGTLISTDPVLALAYGNLLRANAAALFPSSYGALTSDERQARMALLAGDASLTRFLHELTNPAAPAADALPVEDPDHPLNQVPAPDFIRQREVLGLSAGFELAQTIHSAGGWKRLSAAYAEPPRSTAEVLNSELYLAETRLPPTPVGIVKPPAEGKAPIWDDRLGAATLVYFLKRYMEPEDAHKAAVGWRGDRFLAYAAATGNGRGDAVWRITTASADAAKALRAAMKTALLQHYELPPDTPFPDALKAGGRSLKLTAEGSDLTLVDAAE